MPYKACLPLHGSLKRGFSPWDDGYSYSTWTALYATTNIANTSSEWCARSSKCWPLGPLLPANQFFTVRSLAPVHRITVFTA